MNDTKKTTYSFYERNLSKNERKKNKSNSNDPVQFYTRNPFKLNDIKKKLMHFNFIKEIPLKINRHKNI